MTTPSIPTACVIGWPIKHSRSPIIHRYWLQQLGIAGDYVRHAVAPEDVGAFFRDFAKGPFIGANVTVPHKEAAFAAVSRADAVATALGAVNTVWLEEGALVGANTDAPGFLANLDQLAPGFDSAGGPAIVLGAGGAARAVIWALKARGFAPVHVVNRTRARAEALAERFGPGIEAASFEDLPALLPHAALLVNTTSLGMQGEPPLEIDLGPADDRLLVTDIVYIPLETPLLAAAKARGLRTVDGLGMLLHQAVPGFEHWFGQRPVVTDELRALILADIGQVA
ncbi:shikimate dehydrogenase [Kaistia dalseonensis]|uniref:Shikimate dehydrogenase (NADP(+)) n=1 Tax=Kaistia dalseonensis TaxID=410840 RepID=A0ABU0H537_9HYPH|nr:shikimate dehydrogenase [Kaistia dalseonensis]MCX5494842.1 shikimate dehydrogenase [Kaistia dalseonensis]MDQ0437423.1 shikimate dehydrogenase [Kaistia dalseonensis]